MRKIAAALMVAFAAASAQAGTVQVTARTDLTVANWASTLSVAQYDGSLGALSSVEVRLTNYTNAAFGFANNGGNSVTFDTSMGDYAGVRSAVTLAGTGDLAGTTFARASANYGYSRLDGLTVGVGESFTSAMEEGTGGDIRTFSDASMLAAFTGSGNMSFSAVGTASASYAGDSNIVFAPAAASWGNVVVIYHTVDDPIPEPAGVALLGLGLVALLGARRRIS